MHCLVRRCYNCLAAIPALKPFRLSLGLLHETCSINLHNKRADVIFFYAAKNSLSLSLSCVKGFMHTSRWVLSSRI